MKDNYTILGAGIAGIAAACRLQELGISAVVYEQEDVYGGLCNSFVIEGFTFDTFAHISFDSSTQKWLENQTEHYIHKPEALNFDRGHWLKHPVQMNLYPLPLEEKNRIIADFVDRPRNNHSNNFGEWLKSTYGECFAKQYPYKYTRKYWTVEPECLETKWINGRMSSVTLEDMLKGAMREQANYEHYSKIACYPKNGGFMSFLKPMATKCDIRCNKKIVGIDCDEKKLYFEDGSIEKYENLISTIPITELCACIKQLPDEIKMYVEQLDYTTGIMVSLGLNKERVSPSLWFYIYDEDIIPARVYSPDRKSPNNVPRGCSAIQAEIYFSKYKPRKKTLENILDDTIEQLLTLGLFQREDIIVTDVREKKYANIMFTPSIYTAREKIHKYLHSIGINYAGRFGEWDYLWIGQSLMSGRKAVDNLVNNTRQN